MAKEYIDREAAKESIISGFALGIRKRKSINDILTDSLDRLDKIHNADVAPVVHGRWEYEGPTINTHSRTNCSCCWWWTLDYSVSTVYKYCPNCGAKMDLEVDDASES